MKYQNMKFLLATFLLALVAVQSSIAWSEADYADADPVILDQLKQRFTDFLSGEFFKSIENFLKPIEQNLKQKLSEFGLQTLDDFKQFIKNNIGPLEEKLKSKVEDLIDNFGKFLSQNTRDIIKQTLSDLVDKFRKPILDRLKALYERVRKELGNDTEITAEVVILDHLKEFLSNNIFQRVKDFISSFTQNIRQKLTDLNIKSLSDFKDFVKQKLAPFEERIKALRERLIQRFQNLPIEKQEAIKEKIDTFINKFREQVLDRLKALFEKVRKELGDDTEAYAEPAILNELQNRLKELLSSNLLQQIENFIRPLEENLRQKLSELGIKNLGDFKDLIKEKLQSLEQRFKSIVDKLLESAGRFLSKESREALKEKITDAINKFRQPLLDRLKALLDRVRKEFSNDKETVAEVVILDHLKEFLSSNIFQRVKDFISSFTQNIRQKLTDLNIKSLSDFKDFVKQKLAPFEERIKALRERIIQRFQNLPIEKQEAIKEKIDTFINKFREQVLDRLKALFEKVRKELGENTEAVAEVVIFDEIKEFISGNLFQKFEQFIKSLEENIRGKLAELNIKSLSDIKDLIKQKLAPIEERIKALKESILERVGKFLSQENREALRAKITDFINTKVRQPLLERIQSLLERIERQLQY